MLAPGSRRFKKRPVRIVIVEDHVMFREVLRKICEKDLRHAVVGEAGDGATAIRLVAQLRPDLVLLDLHLPGIDGFGVAGEVRRISPHTRLLVLSSHCDEYTVFRAEEIGVQGFVDKNTNSVGVLKEAIRAVASGGTVFSQAYRRVQKARRADPAAFDKILTNRERAIVALAGESLTDEQMAQRLGISVASAAKHRLNTQHKLGLGTTVELVRYAREHGFTLSAPRSGDDAMLP